MQAEHVSFGVPENAPTSVTFKLPTCCGRIGL